VELGISKSHVPAVIARFAARVAFALIHISSDLTEVLIVPMLEPCDVVCGFVNDAAMNTLVSPLFTRMNDSRISHVPSLRHTWRRRYGALPD